jgi:hypothetical protein
MGDREMHGNETQWKILLVMLIVIILGTAAGSGVGMVTHNAALGFATVVLLEGSLFLLLGSIYLRRR